MRTAGLLLATALVCAGVAACDGGGGSGAVPDHACDMLTTDEASDLLGVPANEPAEDTDRSGGTYCRWSSKDSGFDPDASDEDERPQYYVAVEDETGAEAVQSFESGRVGSDEEGELEVVADLGDDAFFGLSTGLSVRHGDRVFTTFAGGNRKHPLDSRQEKEIERRAAELVIARLGEAENQDVAEQAGECARTQRCSGTRESACFLQEAAITRVTGFPVERFDGTATPGESDTAAVCTYYLEPVDPEVGGVAGRVEVRFEPEADSAEAEYRRLLREFPESDRRPLPGLGTDAFFDVVFGEVVVLTNDVLVKVSYELDDATDADEPTIEAAAVELAKVTVAQI